jgi:hypothetical protein
MKKLFLVIAVIVTSVSVNAQRSLMGSHTNFSLGIEGSAPTGLFHTNGYKVGFASFATLKFPNQNFTNTSFTYSPGIGFMVSQDVDFLIKYMGISNSIALFDNNGNFYYNQTANTFGMRLAYTFGK